METIDPGGWATEDEEELNAGGRVGYQEGNTVLPKVKPKDYAGTLKMLLSKEAWNTLDPRTWTDLTFDFAKKARDAGQISDKTYQSLMMPLFGETGEKITKAIAKHDEFNEGGRVGFKYGTFNPDPMKELEEKMRVDYNLEIIEVLKRGEKPTPFIDWVSDNIGRYKSD